MEDRTTFDPGRFCCQNPRCVAKGSFGAGNLTTAGYVDKARTIRQLRCRTCGKRFSSRKGSVFYRSHLAPAQVLDVLNHVQEGCGMRQTGRLTGHKEDTVIRYARLAGNHARALHDRLAAFSPADDRTPTRREVVVRREEAVEVRPRRPRRP